jgi:hypothetical protein
MEFPIHVLLALKGFETEEFTKKKKVAKPSVTKGVTTEVASTETVEFTGIRRKKSKAAKDKQRQNWLNQDPYRLVRVSEQMKATFPALFVEPKLLKVGIYQDIKQNCEIAARDLSFFLNNYVNKTVYLRSIAAGMKRFDINGNVVSVVTKEEQKVAVEAIKRKAKFCSEFVHENEVVCS